jgi:hypothetical protein
MHTDLESRGTVAGLLRNLPGEASAPYAWQEFQRRSRPASGAARRVLNGGALAAAAVLLIASAAVAIRIAGPASRAVPLRPVAPATAARATQGTPAVELPEVRAAETGAARWLASLPTEPAVVRVGTRAAVTTLEDRIAQVDDLLSAERADRAPPAHLLALQQQRLLLVNSLAQVRYAETLADESR